MGKTQPKIDALCDELSNRKVSLCAISEHRWKGEWTYQVNQEWQFVFSGIPENSEKAMYGTGVLLNREMTRAWRDADNFCEFGGGRLLRLRLKLRGRFFSGGWLRWCGMLGWCKVGFRGVFPGYHLLAII